MTTRWLLVLAFAALAACSVRPGYVPLSDHGRFGYAVEDTGPASIRVRFVAPRRMVDGYRDPAASPVARQAVSEAFDMALLRASEAVLERGWPELTVAHRENDVDAEMRYYDDYFNSGYFANRYGGAGKWVLNRQPEATLRTTVVIDVTLHRGTDGDRGTVVAAEMVDELRSLYGL